MPTNKFISQQTVGADLSRPPPIYRPFVSIQHIQVILLKLIIGSGATHPHVQIYLLMCIIGPLLSI